MVVFEGGLKRGSNPKDTYYDEVDLTPYLKKGDNNTSDFPNQAFVLMPTRV
jgi:alpha-L-rhamnosidase